MVIDELRKKIDSVKIEKIKQKHINLGWYNWVNKSEIVNVLNQPPYRYTKNQLKTYLKNSNNKNTKMFAVIDKNLNKYFGNIRLTNINKDNSFCNYGRLIGENSYKKKGYGLVMLYKICEYAFKTLKINKVSTYVYTDNKNSINSNKAFGMKKEGLLKSHFYKNGKFKDVIIFSFFSKDFFKLEKKIYKK